MTKVESAKTNNPKVPAKTIDTEMTGRKVKRSLGRHLHAAIRQVEFSKV